MREALQAGEAIAVADAFRRAACAPQFARKPLPPHIFTLAIRAAHDIGDAEMGADLLRQARTHHPDSADNWDRLTSLNLRVRANSVEAAMERADVDAALVQVRVAEADPTTDPMTLQRMYEVTENWLGMLGLEDALLRAQGCSSPSHLPVPAAMAAAVARLELGLEQEALRLIRAVREVNPSAPPVRRREAAALARVGDHAAATALRTELWNEGVTGVFSSLAQGLIATGDFQSCERLMAEAVGRGEPSLRTAVELVRVNLLQARGAEEEGLHHLQALEGVLDEAEFVRQLARAAAATRRGDLLEGLLRRVECWLATPAGAANLLKLGPAILRAHWACLLNRTALAGVLRQIESRTLTAAAAEQVCGILADQSESRRAVAVVRRSLVSFPSNQRLWEQLFTVLRRLNDTPGLAEARAALQATVPSRIAVNFMLGIVPSAWDLAELPSMLRHAVTLPDGRQKSRFLSSLRRVSLDADAAQAAHKAIKTVRGITAVQLALIVTRSLEVQRVESAVVRPVSFTVFRASRAEAARRIEAEALRCVEAEAQVIEPSGSDPAPWLAEGLDCLRRIDRGPPTVLLHTADLFSDAVDLAAVLLRRIREGQPTSALRLGDGEGHFLARPDESAEEVALDRATIQFTWWGDRRLDATQTGIVEASFRKAVARADVVGVIPLWRFFRQSTNSSQVRTAGRGLVRVLRHAAEHLREGERLITSAHFHHDLHVWNLWGEVLSVVRSVSWISCHDLAPYLWKEHGVATRQAILVPPEQRYAPLFGGGIQDAAPGTLLDHHEDICNALAPQPGEVYLVAAGFLGKIYCDLIRERGGIGLDIGSVADYWMGFETRDYLLERGGRYTLGCTLIQDHGLEDAQRLEPIAASMPLVRSSGDGRRNIATEEDVRALADVPRQRRMLRVVGHPRCASGYMATLFNAYGLQVGHEKLLADGISSWMHVVTDLHMPYGDNASYNTDFRKTVVHVRDPRDAIPSIVLENGIVPSFNFRRLHILLATGEDIARHRTAIGRAVSSFLHWHTMAMRLAPDAVFRVEDAERPVRLWLAEWWRSDLAGAPNAEGVKGYNSTEGARRFSVSKPNLAVEDWLGLEPTLLAGLEAYCLEYGYEMPWEPPSTA